MDTITTSIISSAASILVGILTLIGVMGNSNKSNREIQHKLELSLAVIRTEINQLAREVRKHNNFANRIPVVEEQIKVINNRMTKYEKIN